MRLSRQLSRLCSDVVFKPTVFEVDRVLGEVVRIKRIPESTRQL
jgi:hypothetical protein